MSSIRAALLAEHSKAQTERIAAQAVGDRAAFAELLDCLLEENQPDSEVVAQRAAWAVGYAGIEAAAWLDPYYEALIAKLHTSCHDAIKRNIVRIFRDISLPEAHLGLLADACAALALSPKEAAAVRAFSLKVLAKIARKEPDLWHELRLIAEQLLQEPNPTPGIRSSVRQVLAMRR